MSPDSRQSASAEHTAPAPETPRPRTWLTRIASSPWAVVGLLWVVALLNYLDRLMITTIRGPLKADIAMTDAQFGLLTSVFLWIYGLFSPVGGYIADRFSRRGVIIASLFIWSVVTWATGHAHSFGSLLLARGAMGLSEACYIPAALALIADYHRGPTRSLATGIHMSGIYAGAALGGIGGVVAEHFGWRTSFTGFGAVGIVYAIVVLFLLRDAPSVTERPQREPADAGREASGVPSTRPAARPSLGAALGALFAVPAFGILLAINGLVGVANWGIYGWLPTYLQEHFALGLGAAGMTATGYIQVASFAGVLVGGFWADRWSRARFNARALVPAIGFCVVAPFLFLAASTDVLPLAIGGLIVFGVGRGFFDANLMPVVRSIADERVSATGYGVLNFVSVVLGGAMIFIGGWLKDAHVALNHVFQFSAAGLLIVGLLLFTVRPRTR